MDFMSKLKRRPESTKPKVLKGKDIPSVADYMKSEGRKTVMVMLGAGVSTSAGIPDFRSPDTGLYANLARLKLPYPEAVFEINFFRRNPVPFYTLAHELYPGKFRPTISHSFLVLLAQKGLLHTCFTQNIDTLERRAGVPEHKIIEAHGSFASQRCVDCKEEYDSEKMRYHVNRKEVARCEECNGYVKPDIVFFGEGLPTSFARAVPNLAHADLLIVMGTSLTVHPFASLAGKVGPNCPRVLINLEKVGDFGSRSDDVILLGNCDDIVRDLCRELGWEEELDKLWEQTEACVLTEPVKDLPKEEKGKEDVEDKTRALESIEAKLAQLSVSDAEKGKESQAAEGPEDVGTSKTAAAATMAQKVAREVSSAMKDSEAGETNQDASKVKEEKPSEEGEGKL